jgi:hypothetical protein
MKRLIVIGLFLIMLLIATPAAAKLESCIPKAVCDAGETALVYLSGVTNAQLSQNPAVSYIRLCCKDDSGLPLGNDCAATSSDVFLRLSSATNAHAETPESGTYPVDVCLSMEDGLDVTCQSTTGDCSTIGLGYGCVLELSGDSNAHAYQCGSGQPVKVCCETIPDFNVWIVPPLPTWTTTDTFLVSWDSDIIVDSYDVEYMVMDGTTTVQDWAAWLTGTTEKDSMFGPIAPYVVTEGYTYTFKVKANKDTYSKWSAENSTTIDLTAPSCDLVPLPAYSDMAIALEWTSDERVSGVDDYIIEVCDDYDPGTDTCSGLGWLSWDPGEHVGAPEETQSDTYIANRVGVPYSFHCKALDYAGWDGEWSEVTTTITDEDNPISEFESVPRWVNETEVRLEWSGVDAGGVECFDVQWSWDDPTPPWDFITYFDAPATVTSCTSDPVRTLDLWTIFNNISTVPLDIVHEDSFFFQIRSRDVLGFQEEYHGCGYDCSTDGTGHWNTTIDLVLPEIDSTIVGEDVISIDSSATDATSGIARHYIYCEMSTEDEESIPCTGDTIEIECGPAAPGGGVSDCDGLLTLDLTTDNDYLYWIVAEDRANNSVKSDPVFITKHPLANFLLRNAYLALGQTAIVGVRVKNIESENDVVSVILSGYEEDYYRFIGIAEDYMVEVDGVKDVRAIMVPLEVGKFQDFWVRIDSVSDISTHSLELTAVSTAYVGLEDSDTLTITVGYHPEFPGIGFGAMAVIVALASLIVYIKGTRVW